MLKSKTPSASTQSSAIASLRAITGATQADATRLLKKAAWGVERAIDLFYNDSAAQAAANGASSKAAASNDKKLGQIWDKYKDESSNLITIDGTMKLCEDLDIDPQADLVMFCLATDLGSKNLGEWPRDEWIKGWKAISPQVDSIESMKAQLPALRKRLVQDPEYFKKVYTHTFSLSLLQAGARSLELDTAITYWQAFLPPALESTPSALASTRPDAASSSSPPEFSKDDLGLWCDFMRTKGKAVTRDTWVLFIDFVRSIDKDFKDYDEEAAWPATIDAFVEYARQKKGTA
ncbi:hypothetical protein NliqN6_6700 [Naganishia liquefaciens]|uniref:Defective in cullin neddylation protein n=1 Tax=Naganishia liquefaciens TaxID=104408 RepID=A0A8H3U058_9TREE|nr:hypothetical protein NliqN6_6700 [Naganishia liquefaciens]